MTDCPVDAEALARELSAKLGWEVRLTALNEMKPSGIAFRGSAVSGDRACFVKVARRGGFMRSLAAYQACAELPFVPSLLLPEIFPFGEFDVLCSESLTGETIERVELLDEARFQSLVRSYLMFSQVLARTVDRLPAGGGETSDLLLAFLEETSRRGLFGRFALAGILALDPATCRLGATERRVIHNDFHLGNLAFRGVELAAIYDLENIDFGVPCEDLVYLFAFQYLNCGVLHCRRRRLRELLLQARSVAGYSPEDWQLAVRRCRVKMAVAFVTAKTHGRIGLRLAVRMRRQDRLLRELGELVK